MRTNDKRKNVELTPGEYRLLNDLVRFDNYLGQQAREDTLRTALAAGLVEAIDRDKNLRPLVRPTKKGVRHLKKVSEF